MDKNTNNKNNEVTQTSKAVTTPINEPGGELTYDDKVIQKIIGIALEKVEGLLTVDGGFFSNLTGKIVNTDNITKGIGVEVGKEQVAVDLEIVAEYDRDIEKIYKAIVKIISEQVHKMTGLDVVEVNVEVVDIKTAEQYDKDSTTIQDHVENAASATGEFASKQANKVKSKAEEVSDNHAEKKAAKETEKATPELSEITPSSESQEPRVN